MREEKKIIEGVKEYLKAIRLLKRERFHLLEEYHDIPSISSPSFEEKRNMPIAPTTYMNDYTQHRELLLKKIECFDKYIDQFNLYTFFLTSRQRQIIQVYLDSMTYHEMIEKLEEHYCISQSTYKRELPQICLELSKKINYKDIPTLDKINKEFFNNCIKKE